MRCPRKTEPDMLMFTSDSGLANSCAFIPFTVISFIGQILDNFCLNISRNCHLSHREPILLSSPRAIKRYQKLMVNRTLARWRHLNSGSCSQMTPYCKCPICIHTAILGDSGDVNLNLQILKNIIAYLVK